MSLIGELRDTFMQLHERKENLYWMKAMDLSGYEPGTWEKADIELKRFTTNPGWLPKIRKELNKPGVDGTEKLILEGWLRFFEANAIESQHARQLQEELVEMEGDLSRKKQAAVLGYTDPKTGEYVQASSVKLRLMVLTDPDETMRKAAFDGLREIEGWLLDHGLLDIVRKRNELARAVGYDDFYEWRVHVNEALTKEVVFEQLEDLERNTRDACKDIVESVKKEHGPEAAEPWHFEYLTRGDLTRQRDPYLQFATSADRWGRSFSALGIRFNDATVTLDLIDRKGKYENGFMHSPRPSFVDRGNHQPALINFTANAVPGQSGSGQRALETLFHEGGHAAHFANIMMPAPCFGQEYAPTSIALAEMQSMFMDNFISDPDWLQRYALDSSGNPMPRELIHATVEENTKMLAHQLRGWLTVPFFEREIYEMPDRELTPENVLETARRVEKRMSFQPGLARPTLAVPHLQDNTSSAYYHAYILAQMAVFQARDFFRKRDGHLLDNSAIGEDLREAIWKRGNEKDFLAFIKDLTGEQFSASATVELVNKPLEQVHAEVDEALEREPYLHHHDGPVDLNGHIRVIHGDELIAEINGSGSFEDLANSYGEWIREHEKTAE